MGPTVEHSPPPREIAPGKKVKVGEGAGDDLAPTTASLGIPDSPVMDAIKNVIASALESVSMPTTPDRRVPQTPGTPDSARTVFKAPGDPILGVPPSGPEVPPLPLLPVTTGSSGSAGAADPVALAVEVAKAQASAE